MFLTKYHLKVALASGELQDTPAFPLSCGRTFLRPSTSLGNQGKSQHFYGSTPVQVHVTKELLVMPNNNASLEYFSR